MDVNVFENYLKQEVQIPSFIKFKKNKVYFNNNIFIYKNIKYLENLFDTLYNKKIYLIKKYYDLYTRIHNNALIGNNNNNLEKEYYDIIKNIRQINDEIEKLKTYEIEINKLYEKDREKLIIDYDINNSKKFDLDNYDNGIKIQQNIFNLKNSLIHKVNNFIIKDTYKEDSIVIDTSSSKSKSVDNSVNDDKNIKTIVTGLITDNKLKSSTKKECSSIKRSDVTFMSLQDLAKLIMNTPELLALMPLGWKTKKKSEICEILFPSEDSSKSHKKDNNKPGPSNKKEKENNDFKLKSKNKKECSSIKKSETTFMSKDDLIKTILNNPELLSLMPSGWQKLTKGEICDILFPPEKKNNEDNKSGPSSPVKNNDDIKIINIVDNLYNNGDLKSNNKKDCYSIKKSETTFMSKDDLVKLILNTPELVILLPSGWQKLTKKEICDILFKDKPDIDIKGKRKV